MTISPWLALAGAGLLAVVSLHLARSSSLPIARLARRRSALAALALASLALVAAAGLRWRARAPVAAASCDSGVGSACAAPAGAKPEGEVEVPRGRPRLIEFHSAHCAACARMAPIVREIEQRCARGADSIMQVTVDDDAGQALAARYGVRALPTFLGVDSAGEEVLRVVGEQPRAKIAGLLGDVRGEACELL